MKITLITTQPFKPPLVGGVDVYTDRVGQALAKLGHKLHILALDYLVEEPLRQFTVEDDQLDDFVISRLLFSFAQRPKEAFDINFDPLMETAVSKILQTQRPDLVIIFNFYTLTMASVKAAKDLGIPVFHIATDFLPVCRRATFINWHGKSCEEGESVKTCAKCFVSRDRNGRLAANVLGVLPKKALVTLAGSGSYQERNPLSLLNPYWHQIKTMEKRLQTIQPLRDMIDHIFVPTQFTKRKFIENGFRPERVHHFHFGIDPDHLLSFVTHEPADHIRFLFIGRFQPYKGLHLLLDAFNTLPNPEGATLTVYGAADGHDDYYYSLIKKMDQNPRISFLGKIPPTDLADAFAEADFFLLPSTWHENSPLIVSDALQSKTPVISSNIGGVTDIVKHEQNGLLFPMGDVDALRATLQRTIDDPELVEHLRIGNELPTIKSYVTQMMTYIPELCKNGV